MFQSRELTTENYLSPRQVLIHGTTQVNALNDRSQPYQSRLPNTSHRR